MDVSRLFVSFATTLTVLAGPAASAAGPLRVAVLDFTNAAPDPTWDALGKGLQSMVTTDLADIASGRDDLQIVERARLVDLQSELKLGASGQVDPKTAAKIGKLAGATHLVAGSFTVVGGKMRLDARMIAVQSGDIAMTATSEGDKDAFFELEKDLVKRLVDGVGVKLQPKERAKLQTVHTADFEAFRAYSEGVASFDAKKYDDALRALEKAARLDDSFALAKQTLAEYERLAADARGHADAAAVAEAERARLLAAQAASWDQAMLDRLTKVMDTTKDPLDKAIAISILIEIFDPDYSMNGHFQDMRDKTDPFVLARLSDRFAMKYVAFAKSQAPKIPLFPFETVWGVHGFPKDPAKEWDTWWKGLRAVAGKAEQDTLNVPYRASLIAKRLHLDIVQRIDLTELACRLLDAKVPPERKVGWRSDVAEELLKIGLTDRAAKILTEIRQFTQDAKQLDEVADWLAWGRDIKAELEKSDPLTPYRRELFALALSWPPVHTLKEMQKIFVGSALSQDALRKLDHARQWSGNARGDEYRYGGDTVLWPLVVSRGDVNAMTGATDRLRAPGFRWFYSGLGVKEEAFFLAVAGDQPSASLNASFTLDFKRAPDWWSSGAEKVAADVKPRVTLLFGMKNILSDDLSLSAFGVRLDGGRATLVQVTLARGKKVPTVETLGETKLGLGAGRTEVRVAVSGSGVVVGAGGASAKLSLPSAAVGVDGFAGMLVDGLGYVEVGGLKAGP